MRQKSALGVALTLIQIGILLSTFKVQIVKATQTIYIMDDGSIVGTDKIQQDGNIYTFVNDIDNNIIVKRSNIVINGNNYTLHGSKYGIGFNLTNVTNVTIQNTNIIGFYNGIYLNSACQNTIKENNLKENTRGIEALNRSSYNNIWSNNIENNTVYGIFIHTHSNYNNITGNNLTKGSQYGLRLSESIQNIIVGNNITENGLDSVWLTESSNNTLHGNNIVNNTGYGVWLSNSSNNTIARNKIGYCNKGIVISLGSSNNVFFGNNILKNKVYGIWVKAGLNNLFYHNNLLDNSQQAKIDSAEYVNVWNGDVEGNYWSDYKGADAEQDGIGDTVYEINVNNVDNSPLMGMLHDFPIFWAGKTYYVIVISDSTISNFEFGVITVQPDHTPRPPWTTSIRFNVTEDSAGFCRLAIPKDVINGNYTITLDGFIMPPSMWKELQITNNTMLYIYFNYSLGFHQIRIIGTTMIPELLPLYLLPFFIFTAFLVTFCRIKFRNKK